MVAEREVELIETEQVFDVGELMAETLKSFTTPEQIELLEGELLECDNNVPIEVSHAFCKGIYARTAIFPAGALVIGIEHTEECLNIVVEGSVSVVIDGEVRLVKAPGTFVSPPFARKIGYVHETLKWITVHPVSHQDVNRLEQELLKKSETAKRHESRTALSAAIVDEFMEDRIDYLRVVEEFGLTADRVKQIVEDTSTQTNHPCDSVVVATSPVHGNGLFALFNFKEGDAIGVACINKKRTKIGRYSNHSLRPNARLIARNDGSIDMISIREIRNGEEITVNYRESMQAAKISDEILKTLTI